ncbi:hypothetical protein AHF37_12694 [Paragonimus kellicotti]|nr:hypothetical protein AHF37_12694 [Paragonimus kellicotti]
MQSNEVYPFDGLMAARTLAWIRSLPVPDGAPEQLIKAAKLIPAQIEHVTEDVYAHYLSDGVVLGYLLAALDPSMAAKLEAMKTWNVSSLSYVDAVLQRKRIEIFLQYARAVGVDKSTLFTVDELNKCTNLGQVVRCLNALSILHGSKSGPPGYWDSTH